jgi:hypothetical protein
MASMKKATIYKHGQSYACENDVGATGYRRHGTHIQPIPETGRMER